MNIRWLTLLLCAVFAFGAVGCAINRPARDRKGKWAPAQTGTNMPRWISDSSTTQGREARAKKREAKARRDRREAKKAKPDKPKRERQERRGPARDEEVITRGGFR